MQSSDAIRVFPKAAISQRGDPFERDADRTTNAVMSGTAQRRASAQLAPPSRGDFFAGSGRPLDATTRSFMEGRFGHDFSSVRIHDGFEAGGAAARIQAKAFTVGRHIGFARGEYAPATRGGQWLLAHELSHVVQQSQTPAAEGRIQRAMATVAAGTGPQTVEELFLCLVICACDEMPNVGTAGQLLKQVCVDEVLHAVDLAMAKTSPIKSEVSYDMTKTPPAPIMSKSKPGEKKAWIPDYIQKYMPGFKKNKGLVRRPDVVIVHSPKTDPVQTNIKKVIEIKFPGDVLSEAQREAYVLIAGSAAKFGVLTPENCQCELVKETLLQALEIIAEMILLSAITAALVADDASVIGIADDVLLAPIGARIAALVLRLNAVVPRLAPLFAPVMVK